jgi:hypothetical protein
MGFCGPLSPRDHLSGRENGGGGDDSATCVATDAQTDDCQGDEDMQS